MLIFDLGFDQTASIQQVINYYYYVTLIIAAISITGRYFFKHSKPPYNALYVDILVIVYILFIFLDKFQLTSVFHKHVYTHLHLIIVLVVIRELSAIRYRSKSFALNPPQIFMLSFFILIIIGTFLLMLPKATNSGISFIDSLFTSTSAVCVTGLIVVDTGTYFTVFGQIIILMLIQIGGIGIMTFISYFSYFFKGEATYQNQLSLKEMTNSDKLNDVFDTLKKIILITFFIEAVGAFLIFLSIDSSTISSWEEQVFFSIFHAISGFCNAGFSTLSNSLYDIHFRFNYPMHMIIAVLFIIGGIGFPIIFNFFHYLKYKIRKAFFVLIRKDRDMYQPWIINLNTRIVVVSTLFLIIVGTIGFYFLEYDNTLAEHSSFGKIVTAFFSAVTPRTAGFNTVDTGALHSSTLLVIIFLMWIGASPASTGGGVKTSTFSIAVMNVISVARGKNRMELQGREIDSSSVKRAFALIILSVFVIGTAIFMVSSFEKHMSILPVSFECFSAFSTVGLSSGITSELSQASKIVIIMTMFIGRISMLTIIIGFLKRVRYLDYKYPSEKILIN